MVFRVDLTWSKSGLRDLLPTLGNWRLTLPFQDASVLWGSKSWTAGIAACRVGRHANVSRQPLVLARQLTEKLVLARLPERHQQPR